MASFEVLPGHLSGLAWQNNELREPAALRDALWRKGLIIFGILLLASSHWLVARPDKQIHNLLFHLDSIPILTAGMLFGWRSAVLAAALVIGAELPHLFTHWKHDPVYQMDQIGEILVFATAGVVVGLIAERARQQTIRLEGTTRQLETVNFELQQNLEKLMKAERMYAVAQLSASLAHEIRNPLASISGAAGILKRGHASAQSVKDCLEIIDKESQRLNKLLTNFLEFARPRAPRFQPTDLVAVLDSVIALARHSAEASAIEFRRTIDGTLPEVECDPEQVKQVLLNLIMNAVQATGLGVVDLQASVRNGMATITVRDEGSGIPEDQQRRIFEPFFTTKESGSGLGLAIAAKIVESHGGVLTAKNAPRKGLAMILQLPVQRVLSHES